MSGNNCTKIGTFVRTVVLLLCVLAVGMSVSTISFGKGKPGGGEITVTLVNNIAGYAGDVSEPQQGRLCLSELNNAANTASYECDIASGGTVELTAFGWENVKRKGNQGYCDLLNGVDSKYHMFVPTRYWYRNNAGCDFEKGVCDVFVAMWSYRDEGHPSHNFVKLPGGLIDIGLVSVVGSGTLAAIPGEGNVFSAPQALRIASMSVTFTQAGTTKDLAQCEIVSGEDYSLGDILFITTTAE